MGRRPSRNGGVSGRLGSLGRGKGVGVEDLRVGDLVSVLWADASEATRPLPASQKCFDTHITSFGVFLGVKGFRTKHAVIAKEVIEPDRTFHYNVLPMAMIQRIVLYGRDVLPSGMLGHLRRKVTATPLKRFVVGGEGGWIRYA